MSWHVRGRAIAGETLSGETTYGQVSDYVRVCEHDNAQLDTAIAGCKAWIASDPAGFQAFNERADAVSRELPGIVRHVQDARPIAASDTDAIDDGTKLAFRDLHSWRQRLNALYRELQENPHGCTLPAPTPEPQPTADDPQLDAYKKAKGATDVIEDAASKVARVTLPAAGIAVGVAVGLVILSVVGRR